MRLAAALLLLASGAAAAGIIDDSDFSRPELAIQSSAGLASEGRADADALVFPLDASPAAGAPGKLTGRVMLAGRPARLAKVRIAGTNAWTAVADDGSFTLDGAGKISVRLDNARWSFRSRGGKAYEWEAGPFPAGTDAGILSPLPGSENEKLGILHLTYLNALDFLAREASTSWWKKTLSVTWPSDGDYFNPGSFSLHLTDALAWDVVLHELGHAVMDGAMDARSAGGAHKIDECYSEGLAWSEGWATFFAGAVALSPDDADAKFEFLVPRRAPIRLENVPADVCRASTNEWRVAAGLWDLTDRHADAGDAISLPFRTLWTGFTGGVTGSVGDAWALAAKSLDPLDRRAGESALAANFLRPAVGVNGALIGIALDHAAFLQSPRGR